MNYIILIIIISTVAIENAKLWKKKLWVYRDKKNSTIIITFPGSNK